MLGSLRDGQLSHINLPATTNIFLAIVLGYLIGQIFRLSNASDDQIVNKDFIYQPKTVRPIFLSLLLGVSLNGLLVLSNQYRVFQTLGQFFSSLTVSSHHLLSTFVMGLFSGLSAWVGNSQAFALNSIADDSFALENLTYAVTNHTTTGIPYLYTLTNLYRSYGMVAGVGAVLAFLVAILLVSRSQKDKKVSFLSIFPSLFNNGAPFMVGIPVLLNLLYVIPFLLIPLVNMAIAALALCFKLMPAAVYPVPDGTPSLLYAFIGTGGSMRALAVSLFCFALDVALYIPFVRMGNQVRKDLLEEGGSHENVQKIEKFYNSKLSPIIMIPGSSATENRFDGLVAKLNQDRQGTKHSLLKVKIWNDGRMTYSGSIDTKDNEPIIVIGFENNKDGYSNIKKQAKMVNQAFEALQSKYNFNNFKGLGH